MGAERDDATAAKPRRSGTDPGLGGVPAGSGHGAAAPPVEIDEQPEAVDFDALHAALGDPLSFDDEAPYEEEDGHASFGHDEDASFGDDGEDVEHEPEEEERIGESLGRSSAQYASSRPHTIPPSQLPTEDPNAPPVIVATEDTVPSAPPQMTKPIHQTVPLAHTPQSGVPFVNPSPPPNAAHGSGPYPAAQAAAGYTPDPAFARGAGQMTVRMPDRPAVATVPVTMPPGGHPRRGKVQTLVVRPRGPSAKQRLFAFMVMLLLVTACGIAVIIWRRPSWVALDQLLGTPPPPAPTSLVQPVPVQTATTATPEPSVAPTPGAPAVSNVIAPPPAVSQSAQPVVSAKPKPKPAPPPPQPSPH